MAVDYLSTLNSNGSGLNITQIVDSLVQAEVQPQRSLVSKSQGVTQVKLTELAQLKASLNNFQSALSNLSLSSVFQVSNSDTSVLEVIPTTNVHNLHEFDVNLEVKQLAQRQTLLFSGYDSIDQSLGDVTLSLNFGQVSENNVFTRDESRQNQFVSLNDTTLDELSYELNQLPGVNSEIIKISDQNFGLAIYSEFGEQNAISISGDPIIKAVTADDYTSVQVLKAQNSMITINGIDVTRENNSLSDVVDGVTLNLKAASQAESSISAKFSIDLARSKMEDFVSNLNDLKSYLKEVTYRGSNNSEGSVFSSDASIKGMQSQLNLLLRQPIKGFGTSDFYLAEMGVMTNRDGSVSLDDDKFDMFFTKKMDMFLGLGGNKFSSTNDDISITVNDPTTQIGGTFDFSYDQGLNLASLGDLELTSRIVGNKTIFTSNSAGFETLTISMDSDKIPASAKINVGLSATQKFANLIEKFLSTNGEIPQKENVFKSELSNYDIELERLDTKEAAIRSRYVDQFSVMEQIVTKLKSTGDYITTMMDAWNKQDN
jgi:flagellar hook-associated protein 2